MESLYEVTEYLLKSDPSYRLFMSGDEQDFNKGIEYVLVKVINQLETEANHFLNDSEEKLSAMIAIALNNQFISVTRESHNRGHVDISIISKLPPIRRRLGEAKIYGGPVYHVQGLSQLIDRYSTGRETFGFILEYVKKPNIKELVEKIRKHLDNELPCKQVSKTEDHSTKWAFSSYHKHSSGEVIEVLHLNCNLYYSTSHRMSK